MKKLLYALVLIAVATSPALARTKPVQQRPSPNYTRCALISPTVRECGPFEVLFYLPVVAAQATIDIVGSTRPVGKR